VLTAVARVALLWVLRSLWHLCCRVLEVAAAADVLALMLPLLTRRWLLLLQVLHLEQGNDDVGRPLLERALEIQEKALGPDHADVLAIKDVLNS